MRTPRTLLVAICLALVATVALSEVQIEWFTVDGGGGMSDGNSLVLRGTAGQPDAGTSSGNGLELRGGYRTRGSVATGVTPLVPLAPRLHAPAPNPFNPTTAIQFDLPQPGAASIRIYNLAGRRVRTLVAQHMPAGRHVLTWNGRDDHGRSVASGVYVVRMLAPDFVAVKKATLLK